MVQVGTFELKKGDSAGGDGMRCGMCVDSVKDPLTFKGTGELESCWVECSERWCRAQYVIEDEESLRVRPFFFIFLYLPFVKAIIYMKTLRQIPPRCYYCRKRKPCPWIECTVCTNRIILPKSYRIPSVDTHAAFVCPPCQFSRPFDPSSVSSTIQIPYTGHQTIVHKLTTLRSILFANEYEVGWLGIKPFQQVFRGRSTFMIWELYGTSIFTPRSPASSLPHTQLPSTNTRSRSSPPSTPRSAISSHEIGGRRKKRLQINGKALLNPSEVKGELDMLVNMVLKRASERCGLSMELIMGDDGWITSCGNEGCQMKVSRKAWEELLNGVGRRRLCPTCWGVVDRRTWPRVADGGIRPDTETGTEGRASYKDALTSP